MATTRIAPSPTGMFHLGTARTAYLNWLMARSSNGRFIVRIDDTDTDRNRDEHTKLIFKTLQQLNLDFDYTFKQSYRLDRYKDVADQLLKAGFAKTVDGSVRFHYDGAVPDDFKDVVCGTVKVSNSDKIMAGQFVLLRPDGMPTYNFATVVDDMDTDITCVLRGSDHLSNTIRQIVLRDATNKALGTNKTYDFGHVGLLHKDKKKMSKRDGASDLLSLFDKGYSPDAVLAYLVRLGWNVSDPNIDKKHPVLTRDLALQLFPTGKMRTAPSNFDQSKLDWINEWFKKQ